IQTDINRYLKVETALGIGEPIMGLSKLRKGFISSLMAWRQCQPGPLSQINYAASVQSEGRYLTQEDERKLGLCIENADLEGFVRTIKSVFSPVRGHSMQMISLYALSVLLLLDAIAKKNKVTLEEIQEWLWVYSEEIWKFDSEEKVFQYLAGAASRVIDLVRRQRASGSVGIVEAIKLYIDGNYAEELSLSMFAERNYIHTTYLSELFKKHVGSTFSEYLLQTRMVNAVKLLKDPALRLSDIADLVGFSNASYFSSVFKKHYGVSPNDFRSE
ncbi:MAG TPA: AraC family transcriptional regulator, partial [Bacilli bacterium]